MPDSLYIVDTHTLTRDENITVADLVPVVW